MWYALNHEKNQMSKYKAFLCFFTILIEQRVLPLTPAQVNNTLVLSSTSEHSSMVKAQQSSEWYIILVTHGQGLVCDLHIEAHSVNNTHAHFNAHKPHWATAKNTNVAILECVRNDTKMALGWTKRYPEWSADGWRSFLSLCSRRLKQPAIMVK